VCVLIYIYIYIYISVSLSGVVNHRATPRHAKILYSNKGGFFSLLLTKSHVVSVTFIHLAPPLSSLHGRRGAPAKMARAPEECRPRDLLQHEKKKVRREGVRTYVWFALVRECPLPCFLPFLFHGAFT